MAKKSLGDNTLKLFPDTSTSAYDPVGMLTDQKSPRIPPMPTIRHYSTLEYSIVEVWDWESEKWVVISRESLSTPFNSIIESESIRDDIQKARDA